MFHLIIKIVHCNNYSCNERKFVSIKTGISKKISCSFLFSELNAGNVNEVIHDGIDGEAGRAVNL
jgi:hypothetical protein